MQRGESRRSYDGSADEKDDTYAGLERSNTWTTTRTASTAFLIDSESGKQVRRHLRSSELVGKFVSLLRVLSWWLPEVASSVLSILSLLSIVLILRIYDGRLATDLHLPKALTLNGLIAAIATFNRACLTTAVCSSIMQEMWLYFESEAKEDNCKSRLQDMDLFHKASIGSLGSLSFLLHMRGSRVLASLGCLIVVLSLGYSTFTQQLVGLALLPSTESATPNNLPRSETWAQWGGSEFDALSSFDPGLRMIAALYSGVLAEGVHPIEAKCSTGNCTWPESPSMAVCGSCAESSFELLDCSEDNMCTYALPTGSVISLFDFENHSGTTQEAYNSMPGFQVIPGKGYVFDADLQDRLYIMNINLFGAPYWSFADQHPSFTNTECALWMCIQAYRTTVKSTLQHQTITSQHDTIDTRYDTLDISGIAFDGGTFYRFPHLDSQNDTSFSVDLWAYLALQQYLYGAMQGTVYWNSSQHFSNDIVRGAWNGTIDAHAWIKNIATSLSNVIRSTNSSSRPHYDGTALSLRIKIRWVWLILPITLVTSSILLLALVIIRTAISDSVQGWKGSPLTFLLFDVDEKTKECSYGHFEKHHGVKRAVGSTRVRLYKEFGGMRRFQACSAESSAWVGDDRTKTCEGG